MNETEKHNKQRIERRISAAASIAMCVVTVLIQIALSLLLTHLIHAKASLVYAVLELIAAGAAIAIYVRSGSPSYKLVWMCLVLALPVAGLLLFFLWGGTHQAKTLSLKKVPFPTGRQDIRRQSPDNIARLSREKPNWGRLASYLQKNNFLLYRNTRAKCLDEGMEYFDDLIDHMQKAERYIFLEYYILAEGQIWDRIFAVLKRRAAQGVEVKIIFDDFGNITRFSDETLQNLQDAGIEVEMFNPVHRYVNRIYFNYRDHRKIVAIDGFYAYTGGINVGDEYANLIDRYGHWRDLGVRIEGEAAWGLAAQFIQMWKMIGRSMPHEDEYYHPCQTIEIDGGFCQTFTDGPLNNPVNPIEDTYLQLISYAKRQLYIMTPYYVVEESMQKALCIAADGGVDVRIMIPAVPDHKLTYMVAETYWGELLAHGVKIYKYTLGFLHAKAVMVDGDVALIGSTNMDYRTFQLHYECAALFYEMPVVEQLLDYMDKTMGVSTVYTLEEWNERRWYRRVFASVVKLFAIFL